MRRLLYAVICGFALCLAACADEAEKVPADIDSHLAYLLADKPTINPYAESGRPAPDGGCTPLRVRMPEGGSLHRMFNDSNAAHLVYARAGGMKPIESFADAWQQGQGLTRIVSNEYLYIDTLTHSYPYLRPQAADLLEEIGRRFADSLYSHGGGAYRLKVTSLLRSDLTVGKLRRVNRNATTESAHRYGTTFDISYSKFICDNPDGTRRTFEDLKNLLARIVWDLRAEGRCLVKHERHQACFHITAAPAADTTSTNI